MTPFSQARITAAVWAGPAARAPPYIVWLILALVSDWFIRQPPPPSPPP